MCFKAVKFNIYLSIFQRKDGGNKLVRIFEKNGKYGFTDSTSFFSLNALIDHFFTHSLKEYNSGLDIKLLYPVTKYEVIFIQFHIIQF